MDIIESKVQLHYRYLNLIFGAFILFGILAYLFCTYNNEGQFVNFIVCLISFVFLFTGSIIFTRKLTKKIVFNFGEKFLIQIFESKTDIVKEEYQFNYTEIKSCFLSSGSPNTCTLKLNFLGAKSLKLILYSKSGEFTKIDNVIGLKIYKKLHSINPGIEPDKPLLMTQIGNGIIGVLLTALLINLVIHITYSNSTALLISLPTTIGLILTIMGTKKKQSALYNLMKSLPNSKNHQ